MSKKKTTTQNSGQGFRARVATDPKMRAVLQRAAKRFAALRDAVNSAEYRAALAAESAEWQATTGTTLPQTIEEWEQAAALAGFGPDRIVDGNWTLAKWSHIIEGALQRRHEQQHDEQRTLDLGGAKDKADDPATIALTPNEQAFFDVLTDEGQEARDLVARLIRQGIRKIDETAISKMSKLPQMVARGVRHRRGAGYYRVQVNPKLTPS